MADLLKEVRGIDEGFYVGVSRVLGFLVLGFGFWLGWWVRDL